ncbi:uncharacterized protein TNCV_4173861 [Trichonephila clavipes]|nr:uncharacterized protein TNCV_4173861 [Trichonephila clavipes]
MFVCGSLYTHKHEYPGHRNRSATPELSATDQVILNHGQETWTTPELAPSSPNYHTHQREDVSALDRFNVHHCPTRRVFSGTGLELVTKQATIRYLYHSALVEKWQLMNRKSFVIPSLQGQNLLLLCKEHSGGHVNTHNGRIWSSENPYEVLES